MRRLPMIGAGFAGAALWALAVWVLALACHFRGFGAELVDTIGIVYVGYRGTPGGGLVGAAWAAVDGFLGGFLLAWLCNFLSGSFSIRKEDN